MDNEKFGIWGRTNLGEIFKFAWIEDSSGVVYDRKIMLLNNDGNNPEEYCLNYEEHIIKHSKKIIDLIEIGDILELREYVDYFKKSEKIGISDMDMLSNIKQAIRDKKIEVLSILTKEQYMANRYKVGGEDESN